jgi:dihydrofolate synthase/folylpolyglutamate synthase
MQYETFMKNSDSFSGSTEVFEWLSRFIHLDRGQSAKSFRLDRMELLAEMAGHPETSAPVIHVAGSKGKGSVTGMITAMLEAWGMKTARYTSPHVSEYRERITAGNDFFDEITYAAAGDELREIVEALDDPACKGYALFHAESNSGEGEAPTFFELMTLYFFLCARRARCDAMVVETGMGGRLDATNVCDPLVSVITAIELEHTEFLGETIPEIAAEKAGIIKPGRPLILSEQVPEALEVFTKTAAEKGSPVLYFPKMVRLDGLRYDKQGTAFSLTITPPPLFPSPLELSISIPGEVQARNAGLAVLAVKTAFPNITGDAIRRGLTRFTLPARFERIRDDPPFVIDGAHTPRSTEFCADTFTTLYGRGGILLFGCAARKDALTMARLLAPQFSRIIITTPGTFKLSFPEQVYAIFKGVIGELWETEDEPELSNQPELICIPDTAMAIDRALELGKETGLPVLGVGSFYLAAEIRNRSRAT